METSTKKIEKFLSKFAIIGQAVVIVLCILVMVLFPDFRFHPIVVLCYAASVLFNNLAGIDRL